MKNEYVKVKRSFLNFLLIGNTKRVLNDRSQIPNFKAQNLGDADPYPGEMEYIQRLQNLGDAAYTAMKPVLLANNNIDEKQRQIETIANDYIQQGYKEISKSCPTFFKSSILNANKIIAKHHELEQVDPQELMKSADLSDIVGYQKHNWQKWINYLKDSLIDDLWIKQVFTIYK